MSEILRQFAVDLFDINAVKFGDFITKIGLATPVYCDLRMLVSYPKLMKTLVDLMLQTVPISKDNIDLLCGVPYTALPIATVMSLQSDVPMVMRRKEAKAYGTKKLIEGNHEPGQRCLMVEDVVTSGSSVLETYRDLEREGIICTEVVIVLDREQGGRDNLHKNGIKLHALFTMRELMQFLHEAGKVDQIMVDKVENYLVKSLPSAIDAASSTNTPKVDRLKMPYSKRHELSANPIARKLLQTMEDKRSNLCIAADLTEASKILEVAQTVGPYVCMFKLHCNIISDFNDDFVKSLKTIAKQYNFVICEDAKYGDICETVSRQFNGGFYKVSSWAETVTAHTIMGPGIIKALTNVFLLAEASSEGNLCSPDYATKTVEVAKANSAAMVGIVCQQPLFRDQPGWLQLTPGCRLDATGDNKDQQYNSPEHVVLERGADIAVVGRGIIQAADMAAAAKMYRDRLWRSYEQRIEVSVSVGHSNGDAAN